MKLSLLKQELSTLDQAKFILPDGSQVPDHYHITEVGLKTKHFVDCGGTVRDERIISFQLYVASDVDHRLPAEKLLGIIAIAEEKIGLADLEIEVEFQGVTIGKYGLEPVESGFRLMTKSTTCLAPDKCDIPELKDAKQLIPLAVVTNSGGCTPGSGCC